MSTKQRNLWRMDSSGVWHFRYAGSAPIFEGSLKCFEANRTKRKRPAVVRLAGPFSLNPAASYSSIRRPYSTIGAGGLNGRVRDGIGCDTSAIATGKRWAAEKATCGACPKQGRRVALDPLA